MSSALAFGARLAAALADRGPLCVGIDPHPGLLEAWGLPVDVDGLARFADICVRAFGRLAAVVKPQAAFFEAFGSAGVACLERTIGALAESGALVIVDAKRGDIGSTMQAYADAYLGPHSSLAGDAVTLSPYLGVGSLDPAFAVAAAVGQGAFVLALTSNPEAPPLQRAVTGDGRSVAQLIVDEVQARNASLSAGEPLGSFGLVVGATIGEAAVDLSGFSGPLLMPGVGAQGGTAEDVRRIAGDRLSSVVPSVSREVLRAGPDVRALQAAAAGFIDDFLFLHE